MTDPRAGFPRRREGRASGVRLSASQQLLAAVLLVALALVPVGILRSSRTLDRTLATFQQSNDLAALLSDARRDAAVAATALAADHPGPEELARAREHLAFMGRQLTVIGTAQPGDPEVAGLERDRRALAEALARHGDGPLDGAASARLGAAALELEERTNRVYTIEESGTYAERLEVLGTIGTSQRLLAGVLGVAVVAGALITWSVRRGVRRDFELAWSRLSEHADELERVNAEVAEANRRLEVANAQLERATATKDEFLSTVSHELRTPLTAIRGFTEIMLTRWDETPDDARRRYTEVIDRQAARQQQLVEGLLVVSSILAGHIHPSPEDVPVAAAVDEAAEATGVEVIVAGARQAVVRMDAGHLQQILTNLFTNARKYGVPPVDVEVELRGDDVALHVTDRGRGIPGELVPVLFDRFTQGDAGDRRTSQGVGLGLAIVRDLAEANGGTVAYTGTSGGARFTLVLPAATSAAVLAPAHARIR